MPGFTCIRNVLGTSSKENCRTGNLRVAKSLKNKQNPSYMKYGGYIPDLMKALECRKKIDEALGPWEATLTAKQMTIILKHQSNWERAVEIFRWFQDKGCYQIDVFHYTILLKILGRAKKWDYLKEFWEEMVRNKVSPTNTTYGTVIDCYGKAGLKEEALRWLDHMVAQGLHPDEVIVSIVVHILKMAGEYDKATQFFQDWYGGKQSSSGSDLSLKGVTNYDNKTMDSSNGGAELGRPRNPYTYNTLIDTYGKAGRLKEASDVFCDMLKAGIIPDVVTYNTMIHICGTNGRLKEADALMMKMEELGCIPDGRTYAILISFHAEHENVDKVLWYFTKMKETGLIPNDIPYRTILYALSIVNRVNEVHIVIQEMVDLSVEIDGNSQSAVLRMYIRLGLLDQAWAWFERFHVDGRMSSEWYAACMDAYGEQGCWLEAEKVFKYSQERGRKISVLEFNVMIKAYGFAKVQDKALKLFNRMESLGVLPDECTYNSLTQMFVTSDCLNDEALEALESLCQLQTLNPHISFYNAIINAFGSAGRIDKASKMFMSLRARGLKPDTTTYRYMLDLYTRAGLESEAQEILQECANEGSFDLVLSFNKKMKRYDKAIEIAEEILETGLLTSILSFNDVIELYVEEGRLREAAKVLQKMLIVGVCPDKTTCKLLGGLLVKGGIRKSIAKQLEILHIYGSIQPLISIVYSIVGMKDEALEALGPLRKLWSLNTYLSFCNAIIYAFGTAGRIVEASKMFRSLGSRGLKPDANTYKYMLDFYTRAGRVRKSEKIFQHLMEKGWVNGWSYALILSFTRKKRRYGTALKVANEMLESGVVTRTIAFNNLIKLYVEKRRRKKAAEVCQKMLNLGVSPDEITCKLLCEILISRGIRKWIAKKLGFLHQDGMLDEASQMFTNLCAGGHEPDVTSYRYMLDLYRQAGLVSKVQETFQCLKEKGWANEWSFAMILTFYRKNKRYNEAIQIAKEMLELGFCTTILPFNDIIDIYVTEGRLGEAAEVLQKMNE
ncbi:hypothetical protein SUGI_0965930 [Cryptomeria japonica]|nr:hypothetical protein SUGI_0965930 [Cryptomeria japonica]